MGVGAGALVVGGVSISAQLTNNANTDRASALRNRDMPVIKAAHSNVFLSLFNTKHLARQRRGSSISLPGKSTVRVRLFLPTASVPDCLTRGGTIFHASSLDCHLSHCLYRLWRRRLCLKIEPELRGSADAVADGQRSSAACRGAHRAREESEEEKEEGEGQFHVQTENGNERNARAGRRKHAAGGALPVILETARVSCRGRENSALIPNGTRACRLPFYFAVFGAQRAT